MRQVVISCGYEMLAYGFVNLIYRCCGTVDTNLLKIALLFSKLHRILIAAMIERNRCALSITH